MSTNPLWTRLNVAMGFKGWNMAQLARESGVAKQSIHQIKTGESKAGNIYGKLADALEVDALWLRDGTGKAPKFWKEFEAKTEGAGEIADIPGVIGNFVFAGTVTAGEGWVHGEDEAIELELRRGLRLVKVTGDSAYPVIFPGQYVLVDPQRRPNHENLVVCQAEGQALLKRYLEDDHAPGGFVLVSVNIGQSVHMFAAEDKPVMWPVVAIVFPRALKREPVGK